MSTISVLAAQLYPLSISAQRGASVRSPCTLSPSPLILCSRAPVAITVFQSLTSSLVSSPIKNGRQANPPPCALVVDAIIFWIILAIFFEYFLLSGIRPHCFSHRSLEANYITCLVTLPPTGTSIHLLEL